jgi:ferrochelatase
LASLADRGVRRVVALPAYPQYSKTTSGSAVAELAREARRLGLKMRSVDAYPEGAGYVEALLDLAKTCCRASSHVVVTAHGLPKKLVQLGDPYVEHVRRTYAALTKGFPSGCTSSLAFQSRLGPVEWTRPYLVDEVKRLADAGVRDLVVLPVSFACENLETLYELDREVAGLARAHGIERYCRVPVPGCHPAFIDELAGLVRQAASEF